jgi:putative Holliday junction resolvase
MASRRQPIHGQVKADGILPTVWVTHGVDRGFLKSGAFAVSARIPPGGLGGVCAGRQSKTVMTVRILGLDVGEKTIGLAASDELGITAQGLGVIRRSYLTADLDRLAAYVKDYAVHLFVVGYPKNMNGSVGRQAQAVEEFCASLRERFPSVRVILRDERLTTAAARRTLLEAGERRARRKKVIDQLAAALILQGYLDQQSNETRRDSDASDKTIFDGQ